MKFKFLEMRCHICFYLIRLFVFCFFIFFPLIQLHGVIEIIKDGLFHEALLSSNPDKLSVKAAPSRPPSPVIERTPQSHPKATWIPGYWLWSDEHQDFVWITGIWRIPPPNMQWIPTLWQQIDQSWIRIPGFWSSLPADQLTFIDSSPPEPIDEILPLPKEGTDYFWKSGFWLFLPDVNDYGWVHGGWEKIDPNWILVPAHYVWRPEGYAFIEAYWDLPLDQRGKAYAPIYIPSSSRGDLIVYDPVTNIEFTGLLNKILTRNPDYFYIAYSYFHDQPDTWKGITPPWWQWDSWLSMPWQDQWALWWWYTHPGYPQPNWMTFEISEKFPPPSKKLLALMQNVIPPFIITGKGVATQEILEKLYGKELHTRPPILPVNYLFQLNTLGNLSMPPELLLKPSGIAIPAGVNGVFQHKPAPVRPLIPPSKHAQKLLDAQKSHREILEAAAKLPRTPHIPTDVKEEENLEPVQLELRLKPQVTTPQAYKGKQQRPIPKQVQARKKRPEFPQQPPTPFQPPQSYTSPAPQSYPLQRQYSSPTPQSYPMQQQYPPRPLYPPPRGYYQPQRLPPPQYRYYNPPPSQFRQQPYDYWDEPVL